MVGLNEVALFPYRGLESVVLKGPPKLILIPKTRHRVLCTGAPWGLHRENPSLSVYAHDHWNQPLMRLADRDQLD